MKIKTKNIFLLMFLIIIIGLLLIKLVLNSYYNKEFNKFNYNSAKQSTIRLLNKNENELNKIVKELYVSGESTQKPSKFINYAGYYYDTGLDLENDIIYIKFDIDAQGMLGGQKYGLIYSGRFPFWGESASPPR